LCGMNIRPRLAAHWPAFCRFLGWKLRVVGGSNSVNNVVGSAYRTLGSLRYPRSPVVTLTPVPRRTLVRPCTNADYSCCWIRNWSATRGRPVFLMSLKSCSFASDWWRSIPYLSDRSVHPAALARSH
jgi:hypothetical protein